eukprot:jgi/Hompol1/5209/HPOL_004233-RA
MRAAAPKTSASASASAPSHQSVLQSFVLEFVVLVCPIIVSTTFTAWTTSIIAAQLALSLVFVSAAHPKSGSRAARTKSSEAAAEALQLTRNDRGHLPFTVAFRAYLQLLTISSILAVDFNVFPRRFAKVETFGTSLMDVGVGAFVFSSGLVYGSRIKNVQSTSFSRLLKTLRSCLPVLVLGFARMLLTKSVNYQEHVTEYGVHWNFFFTLAFISVLLTLQGIALPGVNLASAGLGLIVGYEYLLSKGLQEYILNAPRVDVISMNREGICSLIGYYSIFLFAAEIGSRLLSQTTLQSMQFKHIRLLVVSTVVLSGAVAFVTDGLGIKVSRRMANLPYALWVTAVCGFLLCGFYTVDVVLSRVAHRRFKHKDLVVAFDKACPLIFSSINRFQLVAFLVANVMTGIINLSINTLAIADAHAFAIINAYVFAVGLIVLVLDKAWK